MPNAPVLAAGEAMPAANFSRRLALLGGLSAAAALAAVPRAHAAAQDPLADAIAAYHAGMADFMAIPEAQITMGNEEDLVMATYGPAHDRLWHDCPPATSLRGVAEAIRYTLQENCIACSSAENTLESALAFLVKEHGL